MYSHTLLKPDGRQLTLYSRYPIASNLQATSPSNEPVQANPHLRWHPCGGVGGLCESPSRANFYATTRV